MAAQKIVAKHGYEIYQDKDVVSNKGIFKEQFSSKLTVEDKNFSVKTFSDKIGEPHPFDYETVERLAKKFGLVMAIVDKINDYSLGPGLFISSEDENVKNKLEKWNKQTNFKIYLRPWQTESLLKGPGYLEVAGLSKPNLKCEIKVVNSNTMYIKRDEYGNIKDYIQYFGDSLNKIDEDKIIKLNKEEIIQLDTNKIGSSAYGLGIVFSGMSIINDFLCSQDSVHKVMKRKANNPIHAKLGNVEKEDYPEQTDIENFGRKLQYMNNTTEWVTGPNVEMKVLDFGNIGEKFETILNNDLKLLSYVFQVPEAIMGADKGYVGSTEVQDDGFSKNIKAYQENMAFIIKTKIYDKVLLNMGITDADYEVVFGQQTEEEKNKLRTSIKDLLSSNIVLSPGMKLAYEKKLAELDNIDYTEVEVENKRVERKERREANKSFGQQVVLKQTAPIKEPNEEKVKDCIYESYIKGKAPQEIECNLVENFNVDSKEAYQKVYEEITELEQDVELESWIGEYLAIKPNILDVIKNDVFESLAAKNKKDLVNGLLNKKQIEKMKAIFEDGFENKLSLHKIADKINKLHLKDRYIEIDGKKVLQISKDKRAYVIARTETVRLRAEGSLDAYQKGNIEEVMFNVNSAHPCPECDGYSGEVFQLNEAHNMIPVHPGCRCQWSKVTD